MLLSTNIHSYAFVSHLVQISACKLDHSAADVKKLFKHRETMTNSNLTVSNMKSTPGSNKSWTNSLSNKEQHSVQNLQDPVLTEKDHINILTPSMCSSHFPKHEAIF